LTENPYKSLRVDPDSGPWNPVNFRFNRAVLSFLLITPILIDMESHYRAKI
jgi:hypothetical protein